MYPRDAARAAWSAARLTSARDVKLRRFLQSLDVAPQDCWPPVVAQVRKAYREYIGQLATPLWKTGGTLLRVNLIRHADLLRADELALVTGWTSGPGIERNRHQRSAVVERGTPDLLAKLLKRKSLPDSLRRLAEWRRAEIA